MPVDPKKVTQLDGNTFLPAGTEPRDNMFSKEKTKPEERGNATDVRTSKKEVVDEGIQYAIQAERNISTPGK